MITSKKNSEKQKNAREYPYLAVHPTSKDVWLFTDPFAGIRIWSERKDTVGEARQICNERELLIFKGEVVLSND